MRSDGEGDSGDLLVVAIFRPTIGVGVDGQGVARFTILAVFDCHGSGNASYEDRELVGGRGLAPPVGVLALHGVVEGGETLDTEIIRGLGAVKG